MTALQPVETLGLLYPADDGTATVETLGLLYPADEGTATVETLQTTRRHRVEDLNRAGTPPTSQASERLQLMRRQLRAETGRFVP